jgi:hypothetical protein
VAAVDGWCSVEELTRWGFAHAPVVMANEAHSGLARCIRTRDIGVRMIGAADQAGVRQLAMEALPWPADGAPGPVRAVPPVAGGYLAQPDMRRLITTALSRHRPVRHRPERSLRRVKPYCVPQRAFSTYRRLGAAGAGVLQEGHPHTEHPVLEGSRTRRY